jgi:hypothetical protein
MDLRNSTFLRRHDLDVRRGVRGPEGIEDCADGGFVVSAGLFEAGEIVGSQEVLTGPVHGVEVQFRIAALPGVSGYERVFLPVYEVRIFASSGAEAGV